MLVLRRAGRRLRVSTVWHGCGAGCGSAMRPHRSAGCESTWTRRRRPSVHSLATYTAWSPRASPPILCFLANPYGRSTVRPWCEGGCTTRALICRGGAAATEGAAHASVMALPSLLLDGGLWGLESHWAHASAVAVVGALEAVLIRPDGPAAVARAVAATGARAAAWDAVAQALAHAGIQAPVWSAWLAAHLASLPPATSERSPPPPRAPWLPLRQVLRATLQPQSRAHDAMQVDPAPPPRPLRDGPDAVDVTGRSMETGPQLDALWGMGPVPALAEVLRSVEALALPSADEHAAVRRTVAWWLAVATPADVDGWLRMCLHSPRHAAVGDPTAQRDALDAVLGRPSRTVAADASRTGWAVPSVHRRLQRAPPALVEAWLGVRAGRASALVVGRLGRPPSSAARAWHALARDLLYPDRSPPTAAEPPAAAAERALAEMRAAFLWLAPRVHADPDAWLPYAVGKRARSHPSVS
jgi:hypothetical protein